MRGDLVTVAHDVCDRVRVVVAGPPRREKGSFYLESVEEVEYPRDGDARCVPPLTKRREIVGGLPSLGARSVVIEAEEEAALVALWPETHQYTGWIRGGDPDLKPSTHSRGNPQFPRSPS